MHTRFFPLLAALFAACLPARAATVNWTTSTVTAPADVSTAGTLVGAMNVGGSTAQTVNGVTFAVDPGGAGTLTLGTGTVAFGNLGSPFGDFWTAANPGGSSAYAAALDAGRFGPAGGGTVTLGGLTVGRTYLVQLWIVDTRSGTNARVRTVDGVSTTSGGPNNIVTGTFIADAATQVITLADSSSYGPQLNLMQLRKLAEVEWSTSRVIGPMDVSTGGGLVGAMNVGSTTARTVNGVTFSADPGGAGPLALGSGTVSFHNLANTNNDFWASPAPGGDVSYAAALDEGRHGPAGFGTVTLGGLITGRKYLVQLWIADTRLASNSRIRTVDGVETTSGTRNIATGAFIATSTTQIITLADAGGYGPQLNMLQVREVAAVSWSTSTVSDRTDVSEAGTLVGAMNVGSTMALTVNGVPFSADPGGAGPLTLGTGTVSFQNLPSTLANFWTLGAPGGAQNYALALDDGRYGNAHSGSVTLGGLTVGRRYLVQLWIADTRAATNTRIRNVDGVATTAGGPNIATGTFVANATSQHIVLAPLEDGVSPIINMLQVRELAPVTWTTSSVSAATDINTTGTLIGAMNVGATTAQTVNGVTFVADPGGAGPLTLGSGTVSFGNLGDSFGDFWTTASPIIPLEYRDALDAGRYGGSGVGTITLGGLTVGRTYQVQLWIVDTRVAANGRVRTVDDVPTTSAGPNIARGTFVANSGAQLITLGDAGGYGPQVNLLQIREFAPAHWTTSTVAAPADVNTMGTLVGAMNVGSSTARTVNGVTFAADPGGAGPLTLGSGTVSFGNLATTFDDFWAIASPSSSGAYAAALDAGRYGFPGNGSVTLGGLTIGRTYLVQLWIADTRTTSNARVRTVDGVPTTSGGPNIATGTFVAHATTQVITLADVDGYGPQINMIQLREVPFMVASTADSGAGSLRLALANALANSGADTVTFAANLSGATIRLSTELGISDTSGVTVDTTGLPDGLTLSGDGTKRHFSVNAGSTLTLRALTLTEGSTTGSGGSIYSAGTLTAERCTFYGNSAVTAGAIYADSGSTSFIRQCTLSENMVTDHSGAMQNRGVMTVSHCTIAANTSVNSPGGFFHNPAAGGSCSLENSVIAGNTGGDFRRSGAVVHVGANIVQTNAAGPGSSTGPALTIADPLLGPLDYYGGPTPTMRPRFSSPAKNVATASTITMDQRGLALIGAADAGACEANDSLPSITAIADQTIAEDTSLTRNFTIGDSETAIGALIVSITSSNTALVADVPITASNSSGVRQLTATPLAEKFGTTTITITVSDDLESVQETFVLTVAAEADTPSIPTAPSSTNEDTQSTAFVLMRNAADGNEVTHIKVTAITNGTLFQNDGTTQIPNNSFVTFTEATSGLKFTPTTNFSGTGSFVFQASTSNANSGLGGSTVTASLTIFPVADTPTVTAATTSEDTQSNGGLVISRNAADGTEVTHFKITAISGGTLFHNNGISPIPNDTFITYAQGQAGLKFTPAANSNVNGSFSIQASKTNSNGGPGGTVAVATVTVTPIADTPSVTPITTDEDTQSNGGLVISRNAADGTEVTHFKITTISSGTLFHNDGTSPILNDTFITYAQGQAGLKFTPAANSYANGKFLIQASTSDANSGLGGSIVAASIFVTPVADSPTFTSATTNEDTQSTSGLVIGRNAVDAHEVTHFKITAINNGSLYQNNGTTPIPNDTFITYAEGQAGLKFTPAANFNGTGSFVIHGSKSANNTGLGGWVVATVTVTAVEDAPTGTSLNVGEFYTEDSPLNLADIVVADPDDSITVRLQLSDPAAGALSTSASGTVTSTYTPATGLWSASGAVADVNALLAGATFHPAANYNSNFSISVTVTDGTSTLTGSKVMAGTAVNDAPTATNLSAAQSYTEDTVLGLTDVVITDPDSSVTATLTLSSASAGTLSTGTSGSVTSSYNTGTGVWTASGAVASVNTLLANVTFNPTANYNSNFTITTSVSDGVAAPINGSKAMTGTAVNDAPTATNLSAVQSYTEDTILNLTNIVIIDPDSTVTATLTLSTAAAGAFSTGTAGSVTSTYNAGTGVWTASGAVGSVNFLLANVTFNPAANYNANIAIATSVSDGVAPAITGSKSITGTAVNDAPTATGLSAAETYTQNSTLNLADIVITDPDNLPVTATLTLPAAAGTLDTGTSGSVTSTFSAGVWTAVGPVANVNALLASLVFTPATNYNTAFTIATSVTDGVAPAITGSKAMTGILVNQPPTATNLSASETYTEDTELNLTDIVISDVDSPNVSATLTLPPAAGSLSTGTSGSVMSTFNEGVWSASGALANVNTLLANLTFTPAPDYNTAFTIATSVSDGVATISGSKTVTGTPVNDVPTLSPLADVFTDENAATSALPFTVGDAETSAASLTVSASSSDTTLVPLTGIVLSGSDSNRTVQITPAANRSGTAVITLTVTDAAGATGSSSFALTVVPVNDPPTLDAIAPRVLAPGTVSDTVTLTGISAGPLESGQPLTITAVSSNPAFLPDPAVTYTSPDATGSLTLTFTPGQTGIAGVTVTVSDGGLTTSRTFYVSIPVNAASHVTHPGDSGPGSLRLAIANALAASGSQSIVFDPVMSGQTIMLGSEIVLADNDSEDLLTIDASSLPGGLTIDGGPGTNRIFSLPSGDRAALRGLTLTGGTASNGGAISNSGTLTLTQCTLWGNSASLFGGAIQNGGTLTLTQCTLFGNSATFGGAIANSNTLMLTQCTLSGNSTGNVGGAIYNPSGTLTLTNSLIAGNTASATGPDILYSGGTITRTGVNFIGDLEQSGQTADATLLTGDALLAPLNINGGPTQTMRLLPGSPAINAATVLAPALTTDQRGYPIAGQPDIGAYEAGSILLSPLPPMTILEDDDYSVLIGFENPEGIPLTGSPFSGASDDQSLVSGEDIYFEPTGNPTVFRVNVTPPYGAHGTATITLTLNAGAQTFATSFQLTVLPVNDPPVYARGASQAFSSTPGPQTVPGWATGIATAYYGIEYGIESTQTLLGFTVTNDNNALFSVQPAISLDGTLTYTLAPGQMGMAVVTATLQDDGGTANGGSDTSAPQTFSITVKAPLVVTTTADDGPGSLRQAVADAEASPGGDFIVFAPGLTGAAITLEDTIEVLDLEPLIIDASALTTPPVLRIAGEMPHFYFYTGTQATLDNFRLTKTTQEPRDYSGGSIENHGQLTLRRCQISGSRTTGGGGAIYSSNRLTLSDCTLTDNHCGHSGGAILVGGTNTFLRCTFSGNMGGYGGALNNSGPLTLTHCTFTGNEALAEGGAIYHGEDEAVLAWCIVAGNTSPEGADILFSVDYEATLLPVGTNLIGDNDTVSAAFPAGPLAGTRAAPLAPLLAPIGDYGGPTPTMALLPGSPARNAATGSPATTDQRGYPIAGVPDLGAFEAGALNTYNLWAIETLLPGEPSDDPDADGYSNEVEYATGGDPYAYTADPLSATPAPGGGMVFTFPWNPAATDVSYAIEATTDLSTWTSLYLYNPGHAPTFRAPGVTSEENPATGIITVTIPAATGDRTFWRMESRPR